MRSKIGFACVIILKRKRTISKDIIDPIYLLLYRCEVRKSIFPIQPLQKRIKDLSQKVNTPFPSIGHALSHMYTVDTMWFTEPD